jgi:tetratricopeptide (TPR) repeat protein
VTENTSVEAALDAFPDRPAFVWLAVYEGDLRRFHFVTSALVRIRRPGEEGFEPEREAEVRRGLENSIGGLADGPGSPELWNALGTLAGLEGENALARARFARAAKLAPQDPGAWINLALLEREEGRTEAARAAARKARSLGAVLPPPSRS